MLDCITGMTFLGSEAQYVLQTMECTLSQGSDKVVIVICKLASNSIRKQRAPIQLIKSATSNSLTTVSQQNAT